MPGAWPTICYGSYGLVWRRNSASQDTEFPFLCHQHISDLQDCQTTVFEIFRSPGCSDSPLLPSAVLHCRNFLSRDPGQHIISYGRISSAWKRNICMEISCHWVNRGILGLGIAIICPNPGYTCYLVLDLQETSETYWPFAFRIGHIPGSWRLDSEKLFGIRLFCVHINAIRIHAPHWEQCRHYPQQLRQRYSLYAGGNRIGQDYE